MKLTVRSLGILFLSLFMGKTAVAQRTPPNFYVGATVNINKEISFSKIPDSSLTYKIGFFASINPYGVGTLMPRFLSNGQWHTRRNFMDASNYCSVDMDRPSIRGFVREDQTSYYYAPASTKIVAFDNDVAYLSNGLKLTCNIWTESIFNTSFAGLISTP